MWADYGKPLIPLCLPGNGINHYTGVWQAQNCSEFSQRRPHILSQQAADICEHQNLKLLIRETDSDEMSLMIY